MTDPVTSTPQEAGAPQISDEQRIAKICRDHEECAEDGCSLGKMVSALDEAWSEVHRLRAALAERHGGARLVVVDPTDPEQVESLAAALRVTGFGGWDDIARAALRAVAGPVTE